MEPFTVNLAGKDYKIQPLENGSYEVYFTSNLFGVITPMVSELGVEWQSLSVNLDLVKQIGELIEEHEM